MNSYPKKTNKKIGIGQIDVPLNIGNVNINPGDWAYVDTNGWIISSSELAL